MSNRHDDWTYGHHAQPMDSETFRYRVEPLEPYLEDREWLGGMKRFTTAPAQVLREVLRRWPELADDRQNSSPTFEELVGLAGDDGLLGGYVIAPVRFDCRVTVDTVFLPPYRVEDIDTLASFCPDELEVVTFTNDSYGHGFMVRGWWD